MKICFLGAGKIATAITCGLIRKGVFRPTEVVATDIFEESAKAFTEATHCECIMDTEVAIKDADAVVLSVKPQDSKELLTKLHGKFQGKLLISLAAGLHLDKLQKWSGTDRIIRVMPNTPATVDMAASVFCCAPGVSGVERELVVRMFNAIGYACEMDESKMDAVTALSGSGPGFVFAYIEAMVNSAVDLGIERELAEYLCIHTISGSAEMLLRGLGTPQKLREAVTSKNGTTDAGLNSLERDDFAGVIKRCLQAAADRSYELGHAD
jgi:pyrroline-5-carboxylate reductase